MENHKVKIIMGTLKKILFGIFLGMPCSVHAQKAYPTDTLLLDSIPAQTVSVFAGGIDTDFHPDSIMPDWPQEPEIPQEPDEPEVVLSNYSVGVTKGTLEVSNSGAAVYALKFNVPNGGSLTPQIGLSYNSQFGGYGLAGYGFTLTGISAITRGGNDLFHDGKLTGVTYSASDNFFLDGKRLILQSGTAGQDGAIYTLEGDPFTKIAVHGIYSNSSATTWFEVTTSTGMTYWYGNSANSKVTYKNKKGFPRIASWHICKAMDKYSNYITYEYVTDNLSIRPVTITYGMNSAKSRGIVNKISFGYTSHEENARPFYIEDQQGKMRMFLSSVTVTSNNSVFRKYSLTYNDNSDQSYGKWTRLKTVEEANGKGEKLPPLYFAWQYLPSPSVRYSQLNVPTKDGSSLVEETGKLFLSADLNGDGVSDIIRVAPVKVNTGGGNYTYRTHVYVSRSKVSSTGSVSFESPLVYNLPSGMSMDIIKSMFGGSSVMDFDGDGYNDQVFPFQNAVDGHWNQAVFYFVRGCDVVSGKNDRFNYFALNLQSTDKAPLFATLDVDGNGKDEVVCVEQRQKDGCYPCYIVQFVEGTELNRTDVRITLPQGVSKDIEKVFVGDYNNDGLQDLMLLYDGGYKIYFNNGGTTVATKFTEVGTKYGTDFGNFWRIQQGDFDGDGLLDFVYNKSKESCLWIAHNNGDGTFSHTQTADIGIADHASCKDDDRFAIRVCDIDHDGRSDVMVSKAGYRHRGFPNFKNEYTDTQVRWLYSTGSNLKLGSSLTKNREEDADEGYIFLGDFDGDGNIELANYGCPLSSTNNTFNEKINIYKSGYDIPQMGKVTRIRDGMGNSTNIKYESATSPLVYSKGMKSSYPVNTYTLPLPVVRQVTIGNGAERTLTTNYHYGDLRLHIAGRGMLGFNSVSSENTTLGTRESSSITKWDESLWIPTETKASSSIGSKTGTEVSTISVSRSGKNYFAYPSRKAVTDLDGNTTVTQSNYDVSKGVIVDETVKNDGDNMYRKASYSGYQNKAGTWLPTTLTMSQKHADDSTPYTTVTTYGYDDRGNVLSTTVNSGTSMALKTTSTYDVYGNVLSSVTTGSGVKAVTKFQDYDTSGRFVTKSYTNPASAVNTYTYDLWGNVLTESDATESSNVLTTKHAYDGWGRRMSSQLADGTLSAYETGWGVLNNQQYYVKETTTGKPSITTWYDNGGYEVLQETFGARNMPISKVTTYNGKGQVSHVENKTGKLNIKQDLAYDDRGRVTKETWSSGKSTTYSYGNRSVTTTNAGKAYTKVSDAWGNTIKSTDPVCEVEYKYSSIGKPVSVRTQGSTVTMTYDVAGNQLTLSDPDAGISKYTYAADGTLLTQTDGRGVKTINDYDNLGRLSSVKIGQSTISYTYGTTGNEKLRLTKQSLGNNSIVYSHDKYGRVITERRNVEGQGSYAFSYAYNSANQLSKMTYPGGLEVSYQYDANGFKSQAAIGNNIIYKVESSDGLVSSTSFLGKLTATRTRDARGYESNRKITRGSTVLENFDETYDGATDNLLSHKRNSYPQETFSYDNLDRLVSVKSGSTESMRMSYASNGNVLSKTGVGNFSYDKNIRPHAVTEVENAAGQIPGDALNTSFNDLGKIYLIENEAKGLRMDFTYGPDQERWCSELSQKGKNVRTTVYVGPYEIVKENGVTREFYYLDGNTIVVKSNGTVKNCLAFTDNLGSILSVMDENGTKVFDASYDAWGKQTVSLNTIGLHRGYTGHEMLTEFDIINMNGRLYDPILGRFFSPDNYVQMPDNSQSFNRYSYCLNNPLKYTDPSGEIFGIDDAVIAFTAFNTASSMMQAAFEGKNIFKAGALSLLSSASSFGIGEAFKAMSATFGNELLRAGIHGLTSGVFSAVDGGNFISSFVSGATASGMGSYAQFLKMNSGLMSVSTTLMGGAIAWATGGDFLQGAMLGMNIGLYNHAMHDRSDGIRYYYDKNGNICGEISEIVVKPSSDALAIAGVANIVMENLGSTLKKNSGNSTFGYNFKFYWHPVGEHGFYGNQYIKTNRFTSVGGNITKFTGPIGNVINVCQIGRGIYYDYQIYQKDGYTDGFYTVQEMAGFVGGWAGAWMGVKAGGLFGVWIGGVPGAILGGFLGGIGGALGGSNLGIFSMKMAYGR